MYYDDLGNDFDIEDIEQVEDSGLTNDGEGTIQGENVHKILAGENKYIDGGDNPFGAEEPYTPPHYPGSENISVEERAWADIDSLDNFEKRELGPFESLVDVLATPMHWWSGKASS